MKIVTVLGARPQFIKAGTVSQEIAKHKDIKEVIVHTGQHYDSNMSDIFFKQMGLPRPDYLLGVGGKSHGAMTGQMMEKIEEILLREKPHIVLVYGDTDSTLAGALAGAKLHVPIAHVEAGLRSFDMKMPEEINRILTDRVSTWLFCPTETAVKNLKNEGFPFFIYQSPITNRFQLITNVGDVMQDAALFYKQYAKRPENVKIEDKFILSTIHRAENTDNEKRLRGIFEALEEIAKEKQVILPLHPRTKKLLQNYSLITNNITLIDPVGYLEMVWLLENSDMVLTDSGGVQKEAFFFKRPCITLRDETEWVELVDIGVNKLVGADKEKIIKTYKQFTNNQSPITNHQSLNLYGDAKASKKIVSELLKAS